MPRWPSVPPAMAKHWLEEFESGTSRDDLKAKYRRDFRTIDHHLGKARQQRAFELAQKEHLVNALDKHQEDLLGLIERLAVNLSVPDLELWPGRVDFGLEAVVLETEHRLEREVGLGETGWDSMPGEGGAVVVVRDRNGPQEIRITEEGSRAWDRLKQHLGGRDPLWREIRRWKETLLSELVARADLNRTIVHEVKTVFKAPVQMAFTTQESHLNHVFPPLVRAAAVRQLLGDRSDDFVRRFSWSGDELMDHQTNRALGRLPGDREKVLEGIAALVEQLATKPRSASSAPASALKEAHRELVAQTEKVRDVLDDYRSLHYVAGLCSACKKLAGL